MRNVNGDGSQLGGERSQFEIQSKTETFIQNLGLFGETRVNR